MWYIHCDLPTQLCISRLCISNMWGLTNRFDGRLNIGYSCVAVGFGVNVLAFSMRIFMFVWFINLGKRIGNHCTQSINFKQESVVIWPNWSTIFPVFLVNFFILIYIYDWFSTVLAKMCKKLCWTVRKLVDQCRLDVFRTVSMTPGLNYDWSGICHHIWNISCIILFLHKVPCPADSTLFELISNSLFIAPQLFTYVSLPCAEVLGATLFIQFYLKCFYFLQIKSCHTSLPVYYIAAHWNHVHQSPTLIVPQLFSHTEIDQ